MQNFCARAISLSILVSLSTPPAAWSARYEDTAGNWTEKYVNQLSDAGVIAAAADGKFNPNKPITRAQLADWLVKVLGLQDQQVLAIGIPDVKPGDQYSKSIQIVVQNNYIMQFTDGFHPNQQMKRAEVFEILSRVLNVPEPDSNKINAELGKYEDGNKVPDWERTAVAEASLAGITINNKNPTLLNPTAIATRGETAAFLSRVEDSGFLKTEQSGRERSQSTSQVTEAESQPPAQNASAGNYGQAYQPAPGTAFSGNQATGGYEQADGQSYQAQVRHDFVPPVNGQPYSQVPQSQEMQPQEMQPQQMQPQQMQSQQYQQQAQYSQQPYQNTTVPYQQQQPGQFVGQPQQRSDSHHKEAKLLQGGVTVVGSGTVFQTQIGTTLDSSSTQMGQQLRARVSMPVYLHGKEVVPNGSMLIGVVTKVESPKHMHAGANGKIEIQFMEIQMPDGRKFPLQAKAKVTGGSGIGRVGKTLEATAIGAGGGALLGTGIGAIVGAARGQGMGKALGTGAIIGGGVGGGGGAIVGLYRKGKEARIAALMPLTVKLESSLQITAPQPQAGYSNFAPPQQ